MADGAGVVEAVGPDVEAFSVGDHVVSTFFPTWLDGEPQIADFATPPGDGIDGYAREAVVAPVHAFTHAPTGYTHAKAATLTTAGLTAWRALVVDGGLKAGATVLVLVAGGSFAAGRLCRAYGTRHVVVGGFVLYALGFAGLLGLSSDTSYWRVALYLTAVGFGSGVITPAVTAAVMTAVDTGRAGVAAGVLNASRQSGSAFAVAAFGALMSTAWAPGQGVLMATLFAIGLSLGAAACWWTTSRYNTGSPRSPEVRGDDTRPNV
ncbi:MFS family permease [Paraburkholderia sp. 32]